MNSVYVLVQDNLLCKEKQVPFWTVDSICVQTQTAHNMTHQDYEKEILQIFIHCT